MEQNHNNETPVEHSNQTHSHDHHEQEEFKTSEPSVPENAQESHVVDETPLIEEVHSSSSPDQKPSEINNETREIDSVHIEEEVHKASELEQENPPLIDNESNFEHHSSPKLDEVKIESEPVAEMKLEEPVEVIHREESNHHEPQIPEQPNEVEYYLPSEQKSNEQSIEEEKPVEDHENRRAEEVKDNYDAGIDEDQPLIVDETYLGIPSERAPHDLPINADRIFETNLRERLEDENEVVHAEGGQHDHNQGDQALDNEFYQHSLQYLVQNLNNLRDTLQTILNNSDLTQEAQGNNANRNNQQFIQNEGMNENNEDHLQDQLMNIRRLLAGSLDNNNAQNNAFGWDNELQNRLNLNNQQEVNNNETNRLEVWGQRIETYARQAYAALPKDLNTLSWAIFILTAIFVAYGYTTIPEIPRENPGYFVDWLAFHRDSKLLLLASGLFYLCAVFKFNQVLHTTFVSDPGEDYYKSFLALMSKYNPFYDLGLYIFVGPAGGDNKLEYFIIASLLVWYTVSTKLVGLQHQKLNQAAASINNNTDQNLAKMKRIQWVSAIYLLINCHVSYTILWLAFYSSYLTLFVFSALSLLAVSEPLKVFLSSTILVKNYSLVSNNNTRELSDPKFKIELLIDLINQFTNLLLIIVLSLSTQQIHGLVIGYYLSFTSAIEKLKNSYNKYSNWLKLQKRLDEIFPIVERSEDAPEEMCSICHENLLIARKLPCGHIFHLKCLIYWLDNQKTCPNCRATIANLNEIMGNNRPEGTISRIFNQLTAPFRTLFNRA